MTRSGTHVVHKGHRIFLSGANTAWVVYGQDFGNHQYQHRRDRYIHLLDQVKDAGGNSMSESADLADHCLVTKHEKIRNTVAGQFLKKPGFT